MTDPVKLQQKNSTGLYILALLLLAMAIGNFLGIRQIRTHAENLINESLPQWILADSIHRAVGEMGYLMASYEKRPDQKFWDGARTASEHCMDTIRKARNMATQKNRVSLGQQLQEMETTLSHYQAIMQKSRLAVEGIAEHRRAVRRSADLFIENIEAYNTMQQHEMERQLEAAFSREQSMVRFGLNLGSPEELTIRHERIQAGSRILANGNGLYAELWEAEANTDEAALNALLPRIQDLRQSMAHLLGVTRQPQNLKQLRSAMVALESNISAVEGLVRTRQIAENATRTRQHAYTRLLAHAEALSSEAHDQAMAGGKATRSIVDHAAKIPLFLGGIGMGIALLLIALFSRKTHPQTT